MSDVAALNDPELRKQAAAKERQRLHLAYCRGEIQWKDKAFKPQDVGANRSPYGTVRRARQHDHQYQQVVAAALLQVAPARVPCTRSEPTVTMRAPLCHAARH